MQLETKVSICPKVNRETLVDSNVKYRSISFEAHIAREECEEAQLPASSVDDSAFASQYCAKDMKLYSNRYRSRKGNKNEKHRAFKRASICEDADGHNLRDPLFHGCVISCYIRAVWQICKLLPNVLSAMELTTHPVQ